MNRPFNNISAELYPDIYGAVYDFINQCVKPALNPDNIFRGWQNRSSLPANTNDYAVITVLFSERRGTNVETYQPGIIIPADGTFYAGKLSTCAVQIDFYSDTDDARQRADCVDILSRSPIGVDFFKKYNIGLLYADDLKSTETVDGQDQYIKRYIVTLHLSYFSTVTASAESFVNSDINIINADTIRAKE